MSDFCASAPSKIFPKLPHLDRKSHGKLTKSNLIDLPFDFSPNYSLMQISRSEFEGAIHGKRRAEYRGVLSANKVRDIRYTVSHSED
jgi:hypothetical protein